MKGGQHIVKGFEGLCTWRYCAKKELEEPNVYHPRVLGLPPDQSDDTWISRKTVTGCGERGKTLLMTNGEMAHAARREVLLVDPSWTEMGDPTVILAVDPDGDCVTFEQEAHLNDEGVIGRVIQVCLDRPAVFEVRIEGDGSATGNKLQRILHGDAYEANPEIMALRDRLRQRGVVPMVDVIRTGGNAHDMVANKNRRAENWRNMRAGLQTLAIPEPWVQLFYEISKMKFTELPNGQLQMEAKKDYKARGNPSPGHADALSLYYSRPVGDPLFARAAEKADAIQMLHEPEIAWDRKAERWIRFYKAFGPLPASWPGTLGRALWYSRRGDSAALWVHWDEVGAWTVFRTALWRGRTLLEICEELKKLSVDDAGVPHEYRVDVCAASEASARVGQEERYHDIIWDAMRHGGGAAPIPVPLAEISGMAGLDGLDRLIAATPSADGPMLCVAPSCAQVVSDLRFARLRTASANADPSEDMPEDAFGGGGALVRCLRMLAVYGIR